VPILRKIKYVQTLVLISQVIVLVVHQIRTVVGVAIWFVLKGQRLDRLLQIAVTGVLTNVHLMIPAQYTRNVWLVLLYHNVVGVQVLVV